MNKSQTLSVLLTALFAMPAAWAADDVAPASEPPLLLAENAPASRDTAGKAVAQDYVNEGVDLAREEKGLEWGPFKMTGIIRARVDGGDTDSSYAGQVNQPSKTHSHLNFDLFPSIRLYKDWRANGEFEAQINLENFDRNDERGVNMRKLWVEGPVTDRIKLRAGKFGAFSSYGRLLDNEVTGAEVYFKDYRFPTKISAGRVTKQFNDNPWGVGSHKSGIYTVQSVVPLADNTAHIGGTYVFVNNINNQGDKDHANMFELGFDFKPIEDVTLMAAFSRSDIKGVKDSAGKDVQRYGMLSEVKYKNADWKVRNSYDVFLNYRNVGPLSGVSSVNDYSKNVKGVQVGMDYVLLKNLKFNATYLHGKQVNATAGSERQDVNVWRTQLEYAF